MNEPTYVEIKWSSTVLYSEVKDINNEYFQNNGFYLVFSGKYDIISKKYIERKFQYIGKAYNQSIKERFRQNKHAYDKTSQYLKENPGRVVLVKAGIITLTSLGKISSDLINDIEACLILTNIPFSKKKYFGRNIIIRNTGFFSPLKEISSGP